MGTRDKRVDAYIAKSAAFAQPIMKQLREIIHEGCPEVTETLKWGMPAFEYKGIIAGFAAFKEHAAFNLWKAKLIIPDAERMEKNAMGIFGRIRSMKDLPPRKTLVSYLRKAKDLNDAGVKLERARPQRGQTIEAPAFMLAAIKKNKKALATWQEFTYSKRKDYIEWVTEAKSADTRERRLETTVEWLSEGKARHWKYQVKMAKA